MKITQLPSGLIVPAEQEPTPEKPPRTYGPMEIRNESDREEVSRHFSKLLNKFSSTFYRMREDALIADLQHKKMLELAHKLLGEDWSYEQLC